MHPGLSPFWHPARDQKIPFMPVRSNISIATSDRHKMWAKISHWPQHVGMTNVTSRSGQELILPTVEEDAAITAACDPDDRPLTDQEWLAVKLALLPPVRQARIARMTEELKREIRTEGRAARPPSPDTRPWSIGDGTPPKAPPANCPAPVAPDQPDRPAASASPGHPPE